MAKFEEYNQVAKFERPQKTCQKLEAKKDFVTKTFSVGMGVGRGGGYRTILCHERQWKLGHFQFFNWTLNQFSLHLT